MSRPTPPFVLRPEDGTVWPNPDHLDDVQWRLRYGKPTEADYMAAAGAIAAYCELIERPSYGKRLPMLRRALRAARGELPGRGLHAGPRRTPVSRGSTSGRPGRRRPARTGRTGRTGRQRGAVAAILALGLTVGAGYAATSEEPDSRTWAAEHVAGGPRG